MKYIALLFCFPFFLLTSFHMEVPDFDAQLNAVVTDFKTNIFDQSKCEAASKKASDIADAIEDAKNEDGVSKSDLKKLDGLKKEAEAIADYISAVGDLSGGFETVAKMNLANERIKGDISAVQKGDFCSDIISVKIGEYICYLAENNDSKMTFVNYKWKSPEGAKSGSGKVQVFANSVHSMYSNRQDPKTNEVLFMGLTCTVR